MRLYLVILDYGMSKSRHRVVAETYWEAVCKVAPGNEVFRMEVVELGEIDFVLNDIKEATNENPT